MGLSFAGWGPGIQPITYLFSTYLLLKFEFVFKIRNPNLPHTVSTPIASSPPGRWSHQERGTTGQDD